MKAQPSICDLAVPGVQRLVPYQPGKPVDELERELGVQEIVKLASNENPLGPSDQVLKAIQNALPELSRYPDGNGYYLKQALAEKYSLDIDQITLGNGSNEVLELVARAFAEPGQEIVFAQHAFAVYPLVTQAVGAVPKVVPAIEYGHDLPAMLAQVNERTRLVYIANPNNPTGTCLPDGELHDFLCNLPAHVICVLDEAYYEYVCDSQYPDALSWLKTFPNLLITRTFSKAYGLAGLRIGYGLSSGELADMLNRVREPFNNNSLALTAAESALQDLDYLERSIALNRAGMEQLTDAFRQMNLDWIPSAGNFVSVALGRPAMPVYEKLLHKGVIVRPIGNYGLPDHLRISVGLEEENAFFIRALNEVLSDV